MQSLLTDPAAHQTILFFVSIVAGAIGSALGLGGGIVIIPTLTLIFKIDIRYAVGASIVAVIATSSSAAATYVKDHMCNIRVAMLLEVATTVGAITGALMAPYIPAQYLYALFTTVLLYSSISMWNGRKQDLGGSPADADPLASRLALNSSYFDKALGRVVNYHVTNVKLGFGLMLGAGVLSALLGIGSGALKVPAMDRAMRLPIKVSTATSNFMIGVTAAASAGLYYMRGDILPELAAPTALGVFVGSFFGTRFLSKAPSHIIRITFVVVLMFIAIQMGIKALGY